MANVITQTEMMKYRGMSVAVFPAGTILTPSAKDWAGEQGIAIRFGGVTQDNCKCAGGDCKCGGESDLLAAVVAAVIEQFKACGRSLNKDEIVAAVELTLTRLAG